MIKGKYDQSSLAFGLWKKFNFLKIVSTPLAIWLVPKNSFFMSQIDQETSCITINTSLVRVRVFCKSISETNALPLWSAEAVFLFSSPLMSHVTVEARSGCLHPSLFCARRL